MKGDIGYKDYFKIRIPVKGRKYIIVGMPYRVIQREADKRQLSVNDFINKFVAIAEYDNFDFIKYTFKELERKVKIE